MRQRITNRPVTLSPRHCFAEYEPSISQLGFHPTILSKCIVCKHESESERMDKRNKRIIT